MTWDTLTSIAALFVIVAEACERANIYPTESGNVKMIAFAIWGWGTNKGGLTNGSKDSKRPIF